MNIQVNPQEALPPINPVIMNDPRLDGLNYEVRQESGLIEADLANAASILGRLAVEQLNLLSPEDRAAHLAAEQYTFFDTARREEVLAKGILADEATRNEYWKSDAGVAYLNQVAVSNRIWGHGIPLNEQPDARQESVRLHDVHAPKTKRSKKTDNQKRAADRRSLSDAATDAFNSYFRGRYSKGAKKN